MLSTVQAVEPGPRCCPGAAQALSWASGVQGEAVSSEAPGLLKRIASQLASLLPSEGGDSNTNLPSIVLIVLAGIGQGDVSTDLAHPKATPAIARPTPSHAVGRPWGGHGEAMGGHGRPWGGHGQAARML